MGLLSAFKNIFGSTQVIPADGWRPKGGTFYFGMGGSADLDLYVGDINNTWYWQAYQFCPTVASICNRKAEAYINGQTKILNVAGKAKGKESDNEAAKKIRQLMSRPNTLQSGSQFEAQCYLYYQIYGFCIILPVKPSGFENVETKAFWVIPPSLIEIKEREKIWYNGESPIQSIKLKYGNEETYLNWDELIILKDFTPVCGFSVIPDSRLRALKTPIETVIKGYRAMNSGFDNTPLGIIGNRSSDVTGTVPIEKSEKDAIQKSLEGYGLGVGQKKFIISNADLNWQAMNYPIESLKIPEGVRMANTAICDGLGYPYELLSNEKGVTFNNGNTAGKALYTKYIIPTSKSIYEQWNDWFKTSSFGIIIENDYSHLPELQEDSLSKAQVRLAGNNALLIEFLHNMITLDRWMELNGEEPMGGEFGGLRYYELSALGWKFGASPAPMKPAEDTAQTVNNGEETNQ